MQQIIPIPQGATDVVIDTNVSFIIPQPPPTTSTSTSTTTSTTTAAPPPSTTSTSTTTKPPSGYTLILVNNADTPADLDPGAHEQYGLGYIDTQLKLTGAGSFKSRPENKSSGTRSEIQFETVPNEGAFEWDMYYTYVAKGEGCHVSQIHPNNNTGSAVLAIWHKNGKFNVRTNDGSNHDQTEPMMTILTDKWYHIRIEYKLGAGAYYRCYIDNTLYSQVAPGTRTIPANGYFKWGFNGGFFGSTDVSEAKKSDINYDNLKIYKKL